MTGSSRVGWADDTPPPVALGAVGAPPVCPGIRWRCVTWSAGRPPG